MNTEMNSAPFNKHNETCPTIGYQTASICVPVEVKPFAKAGCTVTTCCGKPCVKVGKEVCPGAKNGVCCFTISQDVCVAVPVEFGADAFVGDTYVNCLDACDKDKRPGRYGDND